MKTDNLLEHLTTATSENEKNWLITKNLLENLPAALERVVWVAAIPHWFNAEILAALLLVDTEASEKLYTRLQELPFVEPFLGKGFNVHDVIRRLLLQHLWLERHEEFKILSMRAADYFSRKDDAPDEIMEYIYHLWSTDLVKANLVFSQQESKLMLTDQKNYLASFLEKNNNDSLGFDIAKDMVEFLNLREDDYDRVKETLIHNSVKIERKYVNAISKTKIVPPRRRPELLVRKRLLDILFEALDRKLTLISAPAGYGKTSLLIDLIHQTDLSCCWLALDELDRDPQRFASYFISSLTERFPEFGSQSRSILEGMNSFEQDMERLLVTLVNELYEQVKEHFIFIIDDFHVLEGVVSIQNFLNRFIQLVDDNCHIVISSRMMTILSDLPLLVAREQVGGVSFSDLSFRPEEIQALALQNSGKHLSDEEAIRLTDESEGWITGLQFSDSNLLKSGSKPLTFGSKSNLFDFFRHQVLERQTSELQKFILRTSLLEEFDAVLCENVLSPLYPEPQNWQKWIKAISENNLFALSVKENGTWLRYNHLFRDFAREQFKREYPDEVVLILSRLQTAYESMGEWGKAHHVCRQRNDLNALAEMIERASLSMLQSAHLTLESWLNELPPSMLQNRPGLLSIRGAIAYTKGDLQSGLDLLMQSEKIFRKQGNMHGLITALVRRGLAYRFLGDYEASLRDAEEVIVLTESKDGWQMLYAEALRLKGLALYRLGKADQAISFLEHSLELSRLYDKASIPILLLDTGMIYRAVENFSEALNAYEQALQIWRGEGNLYLQASLLNNLGVFHHSQGNYEKSALAFEEGLLHTQQIRDDRLTALISIGFGDLYAELEDFEVADQIYQNAAKILKKIDNRFLLHSLGLSRANLALLQKNTLLARNYLEEVADSIRAGNSNYENAILDIAYGRLHLLNEESKKSVQKFSNAEKRFMDEGKAVEASVSRIWLAAAYYHNRKPHDAIQSINDVVAHREKIPHAVLSAAYQAKDWLEGLRFFIDLRHKPRYFFVQVEWIIDRFNGLRLDSVDIDRIYNFFAQYNQVGNIILSIRHQLRRQVQVVPVLPPRLAIQAFGQVAVSIDGRLLTLSDWQSQSVRELFFLLLSVASPLTREQIGETLWPDLNDPSKLRLRIKNELYRLRRTVGQDVILFKDNHYSFNRKLDYEYDVEIFESFLARAEASNDPDEKINYYSRAIDLVHGPYLNEIYADWVILDRERLGQAHLKTLTILAELQITHSQLQYAVVTCQRAIQVDPGNEKAYQILMRTYSQLGDRSAVMRTYQDFSSAMRRLYGLSPSKETEELYRQLAI